MDEKDSVEVSLSDDVAEEKAPTTTTETIGDEVAAPPKEIKIETGISAAPQFIWQQLLEELGKASSSETEENKNIRVELDKIRQEASNMENHVNGMRKSYIALKSSMHAFGECLYEVAIKEREGLHEPLMNCGVATRSMSTEVGDKLVAGLTELSDNLAQHQKAVKDARETLETYRKCRLIYDSAERNLVNALKANSSNKNTVQAERDAALKKYQELAETMKAKVMMLHQHRIRHLHEYLKSLTALFNDYFVKCEEKIQTAYNQKGGYFQEKNDNIKTKEVEQLLK